PLARALVVVVVDVPRDVDDGRDLRLDRLECRVVEALADSALELLPAELYVALPLANLDGHAAHRISRRRGHESTTAGCRGSGVRWTPGSRGCRRRPGSSRACLPPRCVRPARSAPAAPPDGAAASSS